MSATQQLAALAHDAATALESASVLLPRAALALGVGVFVAWRPWRRWWSLPAPKREIAQAQVLLCVAGCLMVAIIGDSVARAFGLVGIGGLIRFRAALKDPRDGAIFFLLIGLGMAAGLGAYTLVVSGAALLAVILAVVDRLWPGTETEKASMMRVLLRCDRPREVEYALRPAFATARITVKESDADELGSLLQFVVREPTPGAVAGVLLATGVPVHHVRCVPAKDRDR